MTQLSLVTPLHVAVADLVALHGWRAVNRAVAAQRPSPRSARSAPARSTDPETSHLAARHDPDVSRFSDRSRQAKLLMVFGGQPMTDQQAAIRVVGGQAAPSAFEGCRRRCSDLRAAGYLADSGRRHLNMGSSEAAIVWQITIAGRAAITNLGTTGWSR